MSELSLASAFVVGLLGAGHCIGMCGGIVGALTFGLGENARRGFASTLPYQLAYNLGRLTSYVFAGGLMGGLGMLLTGLMPVQAVQQGLLIIAALFMILLGLYLGGWWMGLNRIEKLGGIIWAKIEPFASKLLPVTTPSQAWVLGLAWGWIPCGLVYTMLVWSVSAGGVVEGALLMLAFGLGTLPNLMIMGIAASGLSQWFKDIRVRRVAAAMVLAFGCWTLWRAFV